MHCELQQRSQADEPFVKIFFYENSSVVCAAVTSPGYYRNYFSLKIDAAVKSCCQIWRLGAFDKWQKQVIYKFTSLSGFSVLVKPHVSVAPAAAQTAFYSPNFFLIGDINASLDQNSFFLFFFFSNNQQSNSIAGTKLP